MIFWFLEIARSNMAPPAETSNTAVSEETNKKQLTAIGRN
jgi:hypothetical protein